MVVRSRLLNFLSLLTLTLVLFSFPAFAAIQEVNLTIERNNFSKIDLPIGKDNKLAINLTANKSVDIFIFSEQDLIDYQVNSIIRPTHLSWFKLNTTSFHLENITIYPPGTYFLVIDNTDIPPNGGKTDNSTVTLKGEIALYPLETGINYWLILSFIALLISSIILCLIYFYYISERDAIQQSMFFYLSIFIIASLVSLYGYFLGYSYDASVLGFLSILIQTLAGLLAILFTITLIVTQILAQTYPYQITKYIVKHRQFVIIFIGYFLAIILGIYNVIRNDASYWPVTSFVLLTVVLITAIVPYIFIILEELKPKKIIEHFIKEINRENATLSAEKLGVGDRVKFCSEKDQQSEDPLQPLSDIALNAISKQNHEIARIVICQLNIKSEELISNENNEEDAKKLTKLFGYHLFHIGKAAIANKDIEILDISIKTLQNISKLPKNELAINESIDYLIMLGSECGATGFVFNAYDIISILKDAAVKGNLRVTSSSVIGIKVIGEILIQNKSTNIMQPLIVSNLGEIAKNLLEENETIDQALENLKNTTFLGRSSTSYTIYDKNISSNRLLEEIVKDREKRIIQLIQDEILVSINELKKLAIIYEIRNEATSAYKVLNDIMETSSDPAIKESCATYLKEKPDHPVN